MALLDYLLGGAAGGFEGYERRKAKELQAQKDEEDRQIKQLAMLNQLGFRATGPVRETPDEAARNIVGDISAEVPKPAFDTTMGRAFGAAQKRGFGVAEQPTIPLTSPVSLALDTTKNRQFERARGMQAANPETQMSVKGIGRIGFAPPETEEEKFARELKKLELQQDLIEKRTAATNDRANRGYFAILKKAGRMPNVEYDDVKDIDLKSAYDELKQERSLTGALERVRFGGQLGSYMPGVVGPDNQPQIMFGTRGGSLTPTGVGSAQTSDANIPAADRRNMAELESSIKELDKAIAVVEANPKAFGIKTVLGNLPLTRVDPKGVSARADVTKSVTGFRRTEFGTAMSKQEGELGAPIFPVIGGFRGGDEADAVVAKLRAIRESAALKLNTTREFYGMPAVAPGGAAQPAAPAPAKAPPAPARGGATSADDWIAANPQRSGETDAQYKARYKASVRGGR